MHDLESSARFLLPEVLGQRSAALAWLELDEVSHAWLSTPFLPVGKGCSGTSNASAPEYRLTPKGLDFYPVALALMRWGDTHLAGDAGPPVVLRHRSCGHLADPKWICAHCNTELDPHDVTPEPGPAWAASEPTQTP
jgi:hypothetical protein